MTLLSIEMATKPIKSARRARSLCARVTISLSLALAAILAATSISPAAQVTSYCSDPDRVARWETLSRNNPKDYGIQLLDSLRIGLCQKVDQGTLSHLEMLKIFWASRTKMLAMGVSQSLEDFLEKEAYRDHKRELLEEKVERLREEHQAHLRRYEDLYAQTRTLRRKLQDTQEDYRRRCDTPDKVAHRRCDRIKQNIDKLSEELSETTKEAEWERERERTALRRYKDASEDLK